MGIYEIRKWRKALIFLLALAIFSLLAIFASLKKEEEKHPVLTIVSESEPLSLFTETSKSELLRASVSESEKDASPTHSESSNSEVLPVYVSGAVNKPSLVYLPAEALWQDAVNAAGGLREDAAASYINLAAPVRAHQMIYIPNLEEWEAGQGKIAEYPDFTDAISSNPVDADRENRLPKISLSHAGVEELSRIPGVGEITASAIVRYREEHGPFTKIEEVMQVSGIKEGKFAQMKDYIVP